MVAADSTGQIIPQLPKKQRPDSYAKFPVGLFLFLRHKLCRARRRAKTAATTTNASVKKAAAQKYPSVPISLFLANAVGAAPLSDSPCRMNTAQ
jgi:hypothetical protein